MEQLALETMALALGQVVQLLESILDARLLQGEAGSPQAVEAGAAEQAAYIFLASADKGNGKVRLSLAKR